jgi:hypothetical protein
MISVDFGDMFLFRQHYHFEGVQTIRGLPIVGCEDRQRRRVLGRCRLRLHSTKIFLIIDTSICRFRSKYFLWRVFAQHKL